MSSVRIPIVVKVWAGAASHDFDYISRSLPSLLASDLPAGAEVIIFDDASTDARLAPFLKSLRDKDARVRVVVNETNKGPNWGQVEAYRYIDAEYPDAPYVLNVDDDVIYHRDWVRHLVHAREELAGFGLDGVYTALNMPFRRTLAEVRTGGTRYLLKRQQPALNWLLPREVRAVVGAFVDEGIAYDTVYSHWLRLHGFPVVCLAPSYVQNIGLRGAYAVGDLTTAHDFVGEGAGDRLVSRSARRAAAIVRRLPRVLLDRLRGENVIAPVRWGSEWVYELEHELRESVCVFSLADAARIGCRVQDTARRVHEMLGAQAKGPLAIRRVVKNRHGELMNVECGFRFLPNLRESRRLLRSQVRPGPRELLIDIMEALAPLHAAGVVHNKVRQENVYVQPDGRVLLAWYGTEPPAGTPLLADRPDVRFGGALDARARESVRERFATQFLECLSPEVLKGEVPSPASDVFAAAATVVWSQVEGRRSLGQLGMEAVNAVRAHVHRLFASEVGPVVLKCLEPEPTMRFPTASDILRALSCPRASVK